MEESIKIIGVIVLGLVIVVILALIMAFPTMWLWNWLIPDIFGLVKIDFWQALGINLLTGLLFRQSIKFENDQR